MVRKKFRPAGVEFDGKCRQLEQIAQDLGISVEEIRFADYVVHNGKQWTVRAVFEACSKEGWIELDWETKTHSMVVQKESS